MFTCNKNEENRTYNRTSRQEINTSRQTPEPQTEQVCLVFIFIIIYSHSHPQTGADPGFPVEGGANPRGAPTYDFVKFSEKLHEMEKILDHGGGAPGARPPPKSATGRYIYRKTVLL